MDYKEFYECEMKRADKAEDALAAALARAEAAERRVAELEASREHFQMLWVSDGCKYAQFADDLVAALKIELPDEYEDDEDGTLAVIVAKVAELEARLAEQEWWPVTEPPGVDDYYIVECRYEDDDLRYVMPARYSDGEWVSIRTERPFIGNVIRYHSLPPAATE